MKKIKLLTPFIGLTALAGTAIPLTSCGCSQQNQDILVPESAFNIVGNTLKGFESDANISNCTKMVIPSSVKIIDYCAFAEQFKNSCKITTVVIPGNVEKIRTGAFALNPNVTVYDFSNYTVDQLHQLTIEEGAFGLDAKNQGIYSFIKMNDNWSDVQKEILKNKLINAGVPNYWMVGKTDNNVTLENSKEQTVVGGVGIHEFKIDGHFSSSYNYHVILSRVDGTNGVSAQITSINKSDDFKSIKVEAKMITTDTHKMIDGDWVSYKLNLFCTSNKTNEENVEWVQTIETFKLTFETCHVTNVTINNKQNLTSLEVGAEVALTCTVSPESATNKNVTWTSKNKDILDIAYDSGIPFAVAKNKGKAIIEVKTEDGNKVDSIEINVTRQQFFFTPIAGTENECSIKVNDLLVDQTKLTLPDVAIINDKEYIVTKIETNGLADLTGLDELTLGHNISIIESNAINAVTAQSLTKVITPYSYEYDGSPTTCQIWDKTNSIGTEEINGGDFANPIKLRDLLTDFDNNWSLKLAEATNVGFVNANNWSWSDQGIHREAPNVFSYTYVHETYAGGLFCTINMTHEFGRYTFPEDNGLDESTSEICCNSYQIGTIYLIDWKQSPAAGTKSKWTINFNTKKLHIELID